MRTSDAAPRYRGTDDLRLVGRQVFDEQMTFWLNPIGAIFTVGFAVVFLVLLGATGGNSRLPLYGGIRAIQYYVPGFLAYGVMATCFNSLADWARRPGDRAAEAAPAFTFAELGDAGGHHRQRCLIISAVQVVLLVA